MRMTSPRGRERFFDMLAQFSTGSMAVHRLFNLSNAGARRIRTPLLGKAVESNMMHLKSNLRKAAKGMLQEDSIEQLSSFGCQRRTA